MPSSFQSFSGNAKRLMEAVKISSVIGLGSTGCFFTRAQGRVILLYFTLGECHSNREITFFIPCAENLLQRQAKLGARELLRQRKR